MVFLFRLGRRKGEIGIHDVDTGTGARALAPPATLREVLTLLTVHEPV
jgi:hypothetical protein